MWYGLLRGRRLAKIRDCCMRPKQDDSNDSPDQTTVRCLLSSMHVVLATWNAGRKTRSTSDTFKTAFDTCSAVHARPVSCTQHDSMACQGYNAVSHSPCTTAHKVSDLASRSTTPCVQCSGRQSARLHARCCLTCLALGRHCMVAQPRPVGQCSEQWITTAESEASGCQLPCATTTYFRHSL